MLKLVLLVPLVWLTVTVLMYADQKHVQRLDNAVVPDIEHAALKREAGALVQQPPAPQEPVVAPVADVPAQGGGGRSSVAVQNHGDDNNGPADGGGFLLPPKDPDGPGEMGKPVVLPKNITADVKKLVDEGWQKNAFNQYISDMISVHRKLPDPRDEW